MTAQGGIYTASQALRDVSVKELICESDHAAPVKSLLEGSITISKYVNEDLTIATPCLASVLKGGAIFSMRRRGKITVWL